MNLQSVAVREYLLTIGGELKPTLLEQLKAVKLVFADHQSFIDYRRRANAGVPGSRPRGTRLRILEIGPGRVSTEVDARLSFDTRKTVDKSHFLIGLYEAAGATRERLG
jgi:hypothetical protein